MDGTTLFIKLRNLLQESSTSTFLSSRTSYDYLYSAVEETLKRTYAFTSTQTITTVIGQAAYNLNSDFLQLYVRDEQNNLTVKYNNGTSDYWPVFETFEHQFLANQTTNVSLPDSFTIKEGASASRLSGTTTSAGVASNGECTLTDTSGTFLSTTSAGDTVHNVTDGSSGIVISVNSNTQIVTALFGGTNNQYGNGDSYMVFPRRRFQLILDPPPSTGGHIITVPYIQRPIPVYSPYRSYNFSSIDYEDAVVNYAAWLYKYQDREPSYGDRFYQFWDLKTRGLNNQMDTTKQRKRLFVNFNKRADPGRSRR